MLINLLTTIYWGRAIQILILYIVVVLFVIACLLLLNELLFKKHDAYLKGDAEKTKRILAYKPAGKSYIYTNKIKKRLIHYTYGVKSYLPAKQFKVEKINEPVYNEKEVVEEVITEQPIVEQTPIKKVIVHKNVNKKYLKPQKHK